MSEFWIREAAGKEQELARLRRLLIDNQISDLEYAKEVFRLHPELAGEPLLVPYDGPHLRITQAFIDRYQEQWYRLHDLFDEAITPFFDLYDELQGDFWNSEEDPSSPLVDYLAAAFGWAQGEYFSKISKIGDALSNFKSHYGVDNIAWLSTNLSLDPTEWDVEAARTDGELIRNISEVTQVLERIVGIIRRAPPA